MSLASVLRVAVSLSLGGCFLLPQANASLVSQNEVKRFPEKVGLPRLYPSTPLPSTGSGHSRAQSLVSSWLSGVEASGRLFSRNHLKPSETSPSLANQRQQYQTQGVIFETPPEFSPLQPLGGKTIGIVFPAAATAQTRHVSVRLLEIQPSALGISTLGPRELSEYVRFSFWGLTTPPQSRQTRRFMGQAVMGDVLIQPKNGGMSYLEFYLVPLTQERQLAIAFEADTELPVAILEQTIQTVCATLREDPALLKKKPRRPPASSLN